MLPNLLIIGAHKTGTTWLANCLGEHPDVFFAPAKELHFFTHVEKGLDWYESHFRGWSGEKIIGEKTPGYLVNSEVPAKIKDILGQNIKLIACLRHPIDRAFSAFGHYMRNGKIPANAEFSVYFKKDALNLRRRGFYSDDIERYYNHFEKKNLLVLIYEELKANNHETVTTCFTFLSVDPLFIPKSLDVRWNKGTDIKLFHDRLTSLRDHFAAKAQLLPHAIKEPALETGRQVFNNIILKLLPTKRRQEKLDPDLRQELIHDFIPDIKRLESLLNRDLSAWYK